MRIRTVPLRTGLGLTVLMMGLFSILLVYLSAGVYRSHSIDNQRAALAGMVKLKSDDLLEQLRANASRLGLEVQQDAAFRDAFRERDTDTLTQLLDKPFHQYFVTAGILRLEQLQVLDAQFNAIAASSAGFAAASSGAPCPDLTVDVLARTGSDRLRPLSQLCNSGDASHLAVVVPVGLLPEGYVQVVTDPLHDLRRLEQELGMPLQLTRNSGAPAYRSQDWDTLPADAAALLVDYPLPATNGKTLLTASLRMDMQDFFDNLQRTRNTVMLSVGIATLFTVLLVRMLTDKLIVRPLQALCTQLRRPDRKLPDAELQTRRSIISEFAELRDLYEVLEDITLTDPLTGLCNRACLELRLQTLLSGSTDEKREHALCQLDLDRFRIVNDTCGHQGGDALLQQLAGLFRDRVRSHDLVARIGGDEFAILLEDCAPAEARLIAKDFIKAVAQHLFSWKGRPFTVGVSIGVAPFSKGSSMKDILAAADAACYLAKENGRNRVHFYRPDDEALLARRDETRWANRLTVALETGSFELYVQPIHPAIIDPQGIRMREVLLWMIDPDGNRISPRTFIPAAERYNLMNLIDRWVIRELCARINAERRHDRHPVYAVNLSGQSLSDEGFLHFLIDTLDSGQVPTERLCFEITETAAITNLARASRMISILKGMGIRFALDDFGSGLSSFNYLKHLNVDYVKIDGSFVRGMAGSSVDRRMVEAINQLAHTMDIKTIAECVENEESFTLLQDIGVDFLQGYYIGRPLPIDRMLVEAPQDAPQPRDPNAKVVPLR